MIKLFAVFNGIIYFLSVVLSAKPETQDHCLTLLNIWAAAILLEHSLKKELKLDMPKSTKNVKQ